MILTREGKIQHPSRKGRMSECKNIFLHNTHHNDLEHDNGFMCVFSAKSKALGEKGFICLIHHLPSARHIVGVQ